MFILIVEDNPDLSERLRSLLEAENYTVDISMDGEDALEKIWGESHDLILLDIMLPKLNGLEVLRTIRQEGLSTPVLMLTAKGDVVDKVQGLNLGADDYLAKPFSLSELLARIRALLRRGNEANPLIECGDVTLDTVSRVVLKKGEAVDLTTKEFSILEFLMHNRGRVISRFVLAEHVWGENFDPFTMSNVVNVHIKNLRKKLQADGSESLVKTVRGAGYTIDK
jgi:DNA-binding response OmpR family regulator